MINVKDYGAIGDGVMDDTVAIKAAINASLANNRIEIILNNGLYALTDSITITSCMTLSNGTFIQLTNSKDVIVLEDPSNGMFNIFFNKISLQHKTPSNASQGCLVRQKSVLGFFRWVGNSNSVLCNNGFQGFRSEAPIYLSTFDSVWIYSTWAEGIWIPAGGTENSISVSVGGSTTLSFKNCFISNCKDAVPALRLASGHSDIMIENCATDGCHQFGVFRMGNSASLKIVNCHMEVPSFGGQNKLTPLEDEHFLIVLGSSYGSTIDGFQISYSGEDRHSNSINTAFVRCLGRCYIKGISGGLPTNYKFINTDEYAEVFLEGSNPIIANGISGNGKIQKGSIDNPHGDTPGVGTHKLFTVPEDYYSTWLITTNYSYQGSSSFKTWIVSGCNINNVYTGSITALQSEGNLASSTTLSINGKDIEVTHIGNTNSRWTATRLDIGNRI